MYSRILVCGSRDWTDLGKISEVMDEYYNQLCVIKPMPQLVVIHGAAKGADNLADYWAKQRIIDGWYIQIDPYPAEWRKYGRGAGPIRNRRMLSEATPELVLAFKHNFDWTLQRGGTEDMCKIADAAGIPFRVFGS